MRFTTRPADEVLGPGAAAVGDLNDIAADDGYLFVRDGVGFAGVGVAARVPLDDVTAWLAGAEHDSTVEGAEPLALAALPFLPGSSCEAVVPEVVVNKRGDGRAWVTWVDGADPVAAAQASPIPTPQGATFEVASQRPPEHYVEAVAAGRDAVRRGDLTKVVLARALDVRSDRPINVHAVLRRLKATFGSTYRYSIDGLIGASPELLVEVDGPVVRSLPLAGTGPRTGDPDHDAAVAARLLASVKDHIEHQVVIEMVHDTLLPWASYLDWEPNPSVLTVANVQHLATRMEGMLSQPGPSVVELVRALSPTPALSGHPNTDAIALLAEIEGLERGRYGGAVGWVDARGNGTWAVTIRCAEMSEDRCAARVVAGCGIVGDSDPHAELAETQAKFQAMLSALVRP